MRYSLSHLAQSFDLQLAGDGAIEVSGLCGLSDDRAGCLSFVASREHVEQAAASAIPAFVSHPDFPVPGKGNLLHAAPEYAIARVAQAFVPTALTAMSGRHATAVVAADAVIGDDVTIGAHAVIGSGCTIGAGTTIYPNVTILDRVQIGAGSTIYPGCTIREDCVLGERVILQPGVSIGGDGYGFVHHEGVHHKIPQLGHVVLEDDVEVGANSTIDRGRFSATRVGRGTKIDNLVMLGHNVVTGRDCLLVAQVGISGSTTLGDRVTLAGQVGTVGHVTVTDDVTVLGKGGITKDVREPGIYAGMPLKPARLWRKAMARLYASVR